MGDPTFRLGPIPVHVESSFLFLAVILGLAAQSPLLIAIWVASMFVGVLAHELGHAAAYRLIGAEALVVLHGGGGVTLGSRTKPLSAGEQILVSLAGPCTGITLGTLAGLALKFGGPFGSNAVKFALEQAVVINLFWGLFNLVPVIPMDGGHIVEALLSIRDPLRGRIRARQLSLLVCAVAIPVALRIGAPIAALLFVLFAIQSAQGIALLKLAEQREAGGMAEGQPSEPIESSDVLERLTRMHLALSRDDHPSAKALAWQVLELAQSHAAADAARRALAWVAIGEGDGRGALDQLGKTTPLFDDPLTLGTAHAVCGDAKTALPHLATAWARTPDAQTAAIYGRTLLALGRAEEARRLAGAEAPLEVKRALAEALFRGHDFAGAAQLSSALFLLHASPHDAYNAACAAARLADVPSAMQWLARAIDAGFADLAQLEGDPDLATLRADQGFEALRSRLTGSAPVA